MKLEIEGVECYSFLEKLSFTGVLGRPGGCMVAMRSVMENGDHSSRGLRYIAGPQRALAMAIVGTSLISGL